MPGHPVHPVQPAQPTQPTPYADTTPHVTPAPVHPSVQSGRHAHDDPTGDVVRWAAFSCLLVPVVLVVYGTTFGGAAVATLGLVAVTAVCRVMLRWSEKGSRGAVAVLAEDRLPVPGRRRRHSRSGSGARGRSGARGGGHRGGGRSGARRGCNGSGGAPRRD
ncbi:hypothetical protein ACFVGY_21985 [Streptomyces sp. NPDC127106]|uniref:hypothetical protein n=1 Tax=Streptomyces sp. NPDC127106 TaxID=3345360 RepID=UPI00363632F1